MLSSFSNVLIVRCFPFFYIRCIIFFILLKRTIRDYDSGAMRWHKSKRIKSKILRQRLVLYFVESTNVCILIVDRTNKRKRFYASFVRFEDNISSMIRTTKTTRENRVGTTRRSDQTLPRLNFYWSRGCRRARQIRVNISAGVYPCLNYNNCTTFENDIFAIGCRSLLMFCMYIHIYLEKIQNIKRFSMRKPVGVVELYRGQDFDVRPLSRAIPSDTGLKRSNNGPASCRKWYRFLLWTECGYIVPELWIKRVNSITVASKSDCESFGRSSPSSLFSFLFRILPSFDIFSFILCFVPFYFSFLTYVYISSHIRWISKEAAFPSVTRIFSLQVG